MRALVRLCWLLCLAPGASHASAVQCRLENGAVVVPAAFGDIAGDFIVDISAPDSQLHLTRAQGDGITAATARGDLIVAGERVRDFQIAVTDLDTRSQGFATVVNGVIGDDILARFVVEIRFSPCRMTLYRRTPARRLGVPRLSVTRVGATPTISAAVSDGEISRPGQFAIDTASAPVRIGEATLSRPVRKGVDASDRAVAAARLRALSLAGRLFEQTPASLMPDAPAGLDGAIGNDVWSHFEMRLDLKDGWLELGPLVPDVAPDRAIAPVEKP